MQLSPSLDRYVNPFYEDTYNILSRMQHSMVLAKHYVFVITITRFWILLLHASSYLVDIHFLQLVDRMWQPSDTKPLDPSLYDYSPYFSSKLPPAMVDRWIIPLQMFNSENFYLIGQGNFSTVYYSTIQGPLTTPTQLEHYKNYSEHGVAVKLLNGNRVYAPHHTNTCSDG